MDLIEPGCALVEWPWTSPVMLVASALGHGVLAGALAIVLLALGALTGRPRLRRVGFAALVAVVASGLLANVVKLLVELPRPNPAHESYGFPSGHTTTAFALAAVLGRAAPAAAPLFHLLAVLTGVARIYFRAHFTIDILGGAALGIMSGLVIGRWLLEAPPDPDRRTSRRKAWRWIWALPLAAGLAAAVFFLAYERTLAGQRPAASPSGSPAVAVAFGTPAGRSFLVSGFSADERWSGTVPFTWAEGTRGMVRLPALEAADHRLRLRLLPLVVGERVSCQRVDVFVNGTSVGRLLLDRGWRDYEIVIPRDLLAPSGNEIAFRFAYAASPDPEGRGDPRRLSAAFAALEARPAPRR
ncbi:MAG TPA: phosphatase PAP2 family protein [Candidatus Limnocylindrales bacterium]|nr:phosphatase PAP2 family protein [Candidatus Limnocylindrales bacterium]